MKKIIAVIEGDGIGPEVVEQSIKVLNSIANRFDHQFEYDHYLMGACAIDATGDPLPDETLQGCLQSDATLLGAIGDPKYDHDPSIKIRPEQGLLKLRQKLGLYANIRPVTIYPFLQHLAPLKASKLHNVDFVIFRELTGGIYFGDKKVNKENTIATDTCTYSRDEVERIARPAFEQALLRRKILTLVDKANVLATSRLWRHTIQNMAKDYPEVAVDYMFVDNAAMQILINPQQFDVILTENMFGDILSDEASVLSGSLGLLPSASLGIKNALFEPIHGSYPQAAGKNIANPVGSILSIAMMLEYFGLIEESKAVHEAVLHAIQNGVVTKDLKESYYYTTSDVGTYICNYIDRESVLNNNIEIGQSTII
jgi:3-isopropylmalate dehydrogenase